MSHTVKIKTKFVELDVLKKALATFGWQIKKNSKIRTYPYDEQRDTVYDLIAVNPKTGENAYDIALKVTDTEVEVYGDFYGGSIASQLGANLVNLTKRYAIQAIEDEYAFSGASVQVNALENGGYEVIVES